MITVVFQQSTGIVSNEDGSYITTGFSGNDAGEYNPTKIHGRNNPKEESRRNIGCLPAGLYEVGAWGDNPPLGPYSAPLKQVEGESYGRSSFYVHGMGGSDPANCSRGCIVLPRPDRLKLIAMKITHIKVIH